MKQKEAWKSLAQETNGQYSESKVFKVPNVEIYHKNFKFILDTYTVSTGQSTITYTRLRTVFINKPLFTFKIYNQGFFSKVGKAFGMQDVEIGDTKIDDKFIIKSNDGFMIKSLLLKDSIKEKLLNIKKVNLNVSKKTFTNNNHMYSENILNQTVVGVIKDVEILKSWYYLIADILDELIELDITQDTAPDNCIVAGKA